MLQFIEFDTYMIPIEFSEYVRAIMNIQRHSEIKRDQITTSCADISG